MLNSFEKFDKAEIFVAEIPEKGQELSQKVSLTFPGKSNLLFPQIAIIDLCIKIRKSPNGISIRGYVNISCKLHCHKCLEPFDFKVCEDIDVTFITQKNISHIQEIMLSKADLDKEFFNGHTINLYEWIRSIVFSAIPIKAVCRKDCKGLCNICGANLNETNCNCSIGKPYNPFEILKYALSK